MRVSVLILVIPNVCLFRKTLFKFGLPESYTPPWTIFENSVRLHLTTLRGKKIRSQSRKSIFWQQYQSSTCTRRRKKKRFSEQDFKTLLMVAAESPTSGNSFTHDTKAFSNLRNQRQTTWKNAFFLAKFFVRTQESHQNPMITSARV